MKKPEITPEDWAILLRRSGKTKQTFKLWCKTHTDWSDKKITRLCEEIFA